MISLISINAIYKFTQFQLLIPFGTNLQLIETQIDKELFLDKSIFFLFEFPTRMIKNAKLHTCY